MPGLGVDEGPAMWCSDSTAAFRSEMNIHLRLMVRVVKRGSPKSIASSKGTACRKKVSV